MRVFSWLPFGPVAEISAHALLRQLDQVQIVDVRTMVEFRRSHIAGARHLPVTRFSEDAVDALKLDRKQPVVAICLSAHRSIPAVRQLKRLGYDARQLSGGMKAWWALSFPCVVSDQTER